MSSVATEPFSRVVLTVPEQNTETGRQSVIASTNLRKVEVRNSVLSQYLRAAKTGKGSFAKYYRLLAGLDQAHVAHRAKMSQPSVARAERPGQALRMKGESLKRLAKALNVSVDELLR